MLQAPLPKLPVPNLDHTLDMYLKVLKPIVTTEQYENVVKLTQEFASTSGPGMNLQNKLIERSTSTDNWVCIAHLLICNHMVSVY